MLRARWLCPLPSLKLPKGPVPPRPITSERAALQDNAGHKPPNRSVLAVTDLWLVGLGSQDQLHWRLVDGRHVECDNRKGHGHYVFLSDLLCDLADSQGFQGRPFLQPEVWG